MLSQSNKSSQRVDPLQILSTFSSFGFSEKLSVKKLAGDASSREYYRVAHVAQDNAELSYVLQCAESFDEKKLSTHSFLSAQKLFSFAGVRVPQVIAVNGVRGWILLEDLGDRTLQDEPSEHGYSNALNIILLIAKNLQLQSGVLPEDLKNAPHFLWAFDFEKLNWEMTYTAEHFFESLAKTSKDEFLSLTQLNSHYLSSRPRFFVHRDFHSRNIMSHKNELCVIDFQDARMGPATYDLVSLLWDPYVRLSEKLQNKLTAQFFDKLLAEKLIDLVEKPEFETEMYRMIVQRMLKAIGSYASFYVLKEKTNYLNSIEPALHSACWALETLIDKNKQTGQDVQLLTLLRKTQRNMGDILNFVCKKS